MISLLLYWCLFGSALLFVLCLLDTRKVTVADLFYITIFGVVWPIAIGELIGYIGRVHGNKVVFRLKDKS